jgi:hypothetical protein
MTIANCDVRQEMASYLPLATIASIRQTCRYWKTSTDLLIEQQWKKSHAQFVDRDYLPGRYLCSLMMQLAPPIPGPSPNLHPSFQLAAQPEQFFPFLAQLVATFNKTYRIESKMWRRNTLRSFFTKSLFAPLEYAREFPNKSSDK